MSMKKELIAHGDHVDFINGYELFMQTNSEPSSKEPSQETVSKESNHIYSETEVSFASSLDIIKTLTLTIIE